MLILLAVVVIILWWLLSGEADQGAGTYSAPAKEASPKPKSQFCQWEGCWNNADEKSDYCSYHHEEHEAFVRRHCGNKKKHQSEKSAELHAWELERKQGVPFSTYQCEVCKSYHVGHDKDWK